MFCCCAEIRKDTKYLLEKTTLILVCSLVFTGPRVDIHSIPAAVGAQPDPEERRPGLLHEHAHQREKILPTHASPYGFQFALHDVNLTYRLPPDLQWRAVRCRGRGEGGERHRLQADGGPPQQEHGLLRGARPFLQQGEHHQAHSAAQGGEQGGFAAGFYISGGLVSSRGVKLKHSVGSKCKTWTKSQANVDVYWPKKILNLFIWTQTSFCLKKEWANFNVTFCILNFILHTCKICSDVQHLNLSFNSDLFHKLILHLEIKWHQETNKRIIVMIHQWTSFSDWCAKIPAQHSGIWSICATFAVWHHQTNTCSECFYNGLASQI